MIFRLTHSWNLWIWICEFLKGDIYIYIHTYMGQSIKWRGQIRKRTSKNDEKRWKKVKKYEKVGFSKKSWKVSKKTSLKGRRLYGHLFSVFSTFFSSFSSFFVFFSSFFVFFSLFFVFFLSFFINFYLFSHLFLIFLLSYLNLSFFRVTTRRFH